jgi:hypothetical protein
MSTSEWYIDGKLCAALSCVTCWQAPVDTILGALCCVTCMGTDTCIGWSMYHVCLVPPKLALSAPGLLLGTVIDLFHHTCLCSTRPDCCARDRELVCGSRLDACCTLSPSEYRFAADAGKFSSPPFRRVVSRYEFRSSCCVRNANIRHAETLCGCTRTSPGLCYLLWCERYADLHDVGWTDSCTFCRKLCMQHQKDAATTMAAAPGKEAATPTAAAPTTLLASRT